MESDVELQSWYDPVFPGRPSLRTLSPLLHLRYRRSIIIHGCSYEKHDNFITY